MSHTPPDFAVLEANIVARPKVSLDGSLEALALLNLEHRPKLPLEYMLELLDLEIPKSLPAKTKIELQRRKLEVAKAAAPYCHPKLQAIDTRITGDLQLTVVTGVPQSAVEGQGPMIEGDSGPAVEVRAWTPPKPKQTTKLEKMHTAQVEEDMNDQKKEHDQAMVMVGKMKT
jgi:hypothetical protein